MKPISLLKANHMTAIYPKMSESKKITLRRRRLENIVNYAKDNSPYYSKLFHGLGEDFILQDLPPSTKTELMSDFDNWVTDRNVSMAGLGDFMEDDGNDGRLFINKYLVFATSGSTGEPAIIMYDKSMINVLSAVNLYRGLTNKEERRAYFKHSGRLASICACRGFNFGSGMVRYEQYTNPFRRRNALLANIFDPLPVLIEKIQEFNPIMIGSYPSSLDILAQEQLAGNMNISPVKVISSGEHLSDRVRKTMTEAFGGRVVSSYISTEGGSMATECMCGHLHINDDWLIVEPVDKDNRPVPGGKTADKLLMTNMCNFIQPLIRYELTDRIVYHDEGCDCGNPSPWVEVEGRTHDILYFRTEKGVVRIMPFTLFILIKNIHEVKNFQVFLHEGHKLELRIVSDDRLLAFEKAKKIVSDFLAENGVYASIYLSDKAPELERSGKYFHVRFVS